MSTLIAKTRGKDGTFFKVLTGQQLFSSDIDLSDAVKYNPSTKLDDGSWFYINNFSKLDFFDQRFTKQFVATDYLQLSKVDYLNISFLFEFHDGKYYFQRMIPKQLIGKKYLQFGESPHVYKNKPIIVINDFPDIVYDAKEDTVYFTNLSDLDSIFSGADSLYTEATQEEVEEFLTDKMISLENGFSADDVKVANRKRISKAMEQLEKFTKAEKKKLVSYINDYGKLKFDTKTSKFSISSELELKLLLYGIDERFYTTVLSKEKRLANSVIPADELK